MSDIDYGKVDMVGIVKLRDGSYITTKDCYGDSIAIDGVVYKPRRLINPAPPVYGQTTDGFEHTAFRYFSE